MVALGPQNPCISHWKDLSIPEAWHAYVHIFCLQVTTCCNESLVGTGLWKAHWGQGQLLEVDRCPLETLMDTTSLTVSPLAGGLAVSLLADAWGQSVGLLREAQNITKAT